jgi:asparagine synthase (glutamine-hydrolysing)
MCGIAGEYRRDGRPVDRRTLVEMADAMVHRGPDDAGYRSENGPIGFAFRRLSIIDLDGGNQPLATEDGSIWVLGNGEIYNYRELKTELISLGHTFATGSDIEVVVHGYRQWGIDVVDRLNGMFALAIWDDNLKRLVLVRDHLGIKPLYYADGPDRIRFGSEIRAVTADGSIQRTLDQDSVRLFLHFGYLPAPHTLLAGVRKLPPGHLLIADESGAKVHRYWNPEPQHRRNLSIEDATAEYQGLVDESVARQLVSDVPVGLLLSGGVDSAMVLAAAEKASEGSIDTFTVGFGEDFRYDESNHAAETAALFGGQHHPIRLDIGSFASTFEESLWSLEEPVLSQSTFAFHLLTAEVRKHLKVVLTGQGADELWAGYDRYLGERYGSKARWLFGSAAAQTVSGKLPGLTRFGRATSSLGEADPVRRFAAIHQVFAPEQIAAAARGPLAQSDARAEDVIAYWQEPVSHLDEFSQLLYVDTRMSLADDLLFYGDKLSMANSVEARVPLLDRKLVDFVEELPPAFKLQGRTGKRVHRKAAERMLPKHVLGRPKLGFATPVDEWFAKDLTSAVRSTVLAEDSWCTQNLAPAFINGLIDDHLSGVSNNRRQLTALLSFEIVCRQQLDGRPPGLIDHLSPEGLVSSTSTTSIGDAQQ